MDNFATYMLEPGILENKNNLYFLPTSHQNQLGSVTQGAELFLCIEIWQEESGVGTITLQTFQRPPLRITKSTWVSDPI